jgi:MerR family mercuric resistance operon transcriptional regulator
MDRLMTIGALSEHTEVNIETIRYYERIGILPNPPRSKGRHRLYAEEYQRRLVFVRRARKLGFSLEDVRALSAIVTQCRGEEASDCPILDALAT